MHRMNWDEKLATRHPGMARDHRKMVGLINRLGEVMAEGKGKFAYCTVFDEIVRQTRQHFEMEEQLMAAHHYPKAEEHKAEHASLLKKLLKHKHGVEEGDGEITDSLLHFLDFWWTHHILTSDEEMAEFIVSSAPTPLN